MARSDKSLVERFWEKVEKTDSCWVWTGSKDRYGWFRVGSKMTKAHRFSYIIHKGEIPLGMCVLHKCDNPPCVNPTHLYIGTMADNNRDMISKKRFHNGANNSRKPMGENHPFSKMTLKKVIKAKAEYTPGTNGGVMRLANKYGISYHSMWNILNGRTWQEKYQERQKQK